MLLEPLPNPADAGYPYNPEAAAYLANCYYQFDCSYGGGGWGGYVNTVTGFWDRDASTSGMFGYGYNYINNQYIDRATGRSESFAKVCNYYSSTPDMLQVVWMEFRGSSEDPYHYFVGCTLSDGTTWRTLSLGEKKPTLIISEGQYNWGSWGIYNLHILVYGKMFTEYNWLQTQKFNGGAWEVEHSCLENGGFRYDYNSKYVIGEKNNYQKLDSDGFYFDAPNAGISFYANLTLFGKKDGYWSVIQSFSWGYTINNSRLSPLNLTKEFAVNDLQYEWIEKALYKNNH